MVWMMRSKTLVLSTSKDLQWRRHLYIRHAAIGFPPENPRSCEIHLMSNSWFSYQHIWKIGHEINPISKRNDYIFLEAYLLLLIEKLLRFLLIFKILCTSWCQPWVLNLHIFNKVNVKSTPAPYILIMKWYHLIPSYLQEQLLFHHLVQLHYPESSAKAGKL